MKMKSQTKKRIALLLAFALIAGLLPLNTPTVSKADGYGVSNPRITEGITTWDCIYFGNYWQEDTNGDGTADKNDAKTPIKWRVLSVDGDDAFLLADKNLDCQKYNDTYKNVTWETCTMRSWLNGYGASNNVCGTDYSSGNFLDYAFTAGEQSAIKTTTVVNEDNPNWGTEGGNNTSDQVYLLSIGEVRNPDYGFNTFAGITETKESVNTAYAKTQGAWTSSSTEYAGNGAWWLRSPGNVSGLASYVDDHGDVNTYGSNVHYISNAARPALHLNLKASSDAISTSSWSYAGTVTSDGRADEEAPPVPGEDTTPEPTVSWEPLPTETPIETATPTFAPKPTATPTATPTLSPDISESYKNESDVSILQGIIREQKQKGAAVSEDLDDIEQYTWREGRLVEVNWQQSGVCDKLDVSGLTALEYLSCYWNKLSSLDVSGLTALKSLRCYGNQLSSLDVSKNTALESLNCGNNQLSSLDVSGLTALEELDCGSNQLSSLDVSKNTALIGLDCYNNQLSILDVSGLTALKYLSCDDTVTVIGKANTPPATPAAPPTAATPTVEQTVTPAAPPATATTPTVEQTVTPTVASTATPTVTPTATPAATPTPTATPTVAPTATPTVTPTASPENKTTSPSSFVAFKTQTIKTTKIKTIKVKTLKKKSVKVNLKAKADGNSKLTYKVTKYPKGMKKYIKVNKKGVVTFKKKAKKGTYKIRITAAASGKYKKTTKVISIKVK